MATRPTHAPSEQRLVELQAQHPDLRDRFDAYLETRQAYEAAIGRRQVDAVGQVRRQGVARNRWA